MSNVKRLDFWTVVRTIIEKNPGIKSNELIQKVKKKTGKSRSTIYDHLSTFDNQDKIYREKGRYWIEKPSSNSKPNKGNLKFFDFLEKRAIRKQKEKAKKLEELEKRREIINREMMTKEHEWNPDVTTKIRKQIHEEHNKE